MQRLERLLPNPVARWHAAHARHIDSSNVVKGILCIDGQQPLVRGSHPPAPA